VPLRGVDESRLRQLQPREEACDRRAGPRPRRVAGPGVEALALGQDRRRDRLVVGVGERQVAARRQRRAQGRHQPVRLAVVGDEVQQRQQQHAHRAVEVEQAARRGVGEDRRRVAGVGPDGGGAGVVGQQRRAVGHGDRVDVHVEDAGGGVAALGDLVGVPGGGDAAAQVEELVDAPVEQEGDGAAQEGAVGARDERDVGVDGLRAPDGRAIDGGVLEAAEHVVVHPGHARLLGLPVVPERRRQMPFLHRWSSSSIAPMLGTVHPVGIGGRGGGRCWQPGRLGGPEIHGVAYPPRGGVAPTASARRLVRRLRCRVVPAMVRQDTTPRLTA